MQTHLSTFFKLLSPKCALASCILLTGLSTISHAQSPDKTTYPKPQSGSNQNQISRPQYQISTSAELPKQWQYPLIKIQPHTSNQTLWYDTPAKQWEAALPIGNGRLGAMVYGGIEQEQILLNDDTLWSGPPITNQTQHTDRDKWNNKKASELLQSIRHAVANEQYDQADRLTRKQQGPFNQSYQPAGEVTLSWDTIPSTAAQNYQRQLNLRTGLTQTYFRTQNDQKQTQHTRSIFTSRKYDVVMAHLTSTQKQTLTIALDSKLKHKTLKPNFQTDKDYVDLILTGQAPSHVEPHYIRNAEDPVIDDGRGMHFAIIVRVIRSNDQIQFKITEDGDLKISDTGEVTLLISVRTSFTNAWTDPGTNEIDPVKLALKDLNQAYRQINQIYADELNWRPEFFDRNTLTLSHTQHDSNARLITNQPTDDRVLAYEKSNGSQEDLELVSLIYQFGRYLMMCSSQPGTQPANLQGIWNHQVRPPWSSNWTMNINSQMNYWPVHITNLSECHWPMLQMIKDLSINGEATADINYGARGWVAHHNTDIWRQTAPVGGWGGGDPMWANFALGGVWHCFDLWEYFAFTQDEKYLRDFAYPIMQQAGLFCLDWLISAPAPTDDAGQMLPLPSNMIAPNGKPYLVTCPSVSCETRFIDSNGKSRSVSMASTQDIALIRELFEQILQAGHILDPDQSDPKITQYSQQIQAAHDQLFPYQIGQHGQLQEWFQDFQESQPHHRHVSHLIGLYPGCQLTRQETPELAEACKVTLNRRGDESTGWSMAWKVNLWARLGDGDRALKVLNQLLRLTQSDKTSHQGGGVYTNLFDAHPPFQIDGNFGATAGIAEMLLQSHRTTTLTSSQNQTNPNTTYILDCLPALPAAWTNGKVTGLKARGNFKVDLTWKNHRLSEIKILSPKGGQCQVHYHGQIKNLQLSAGQEIVITP